MEDNINNRIIKDVLASFKMDDIDVPCTLIEKIKIKLEMKEEKKLVFVRKEKNNDFGAK